MEGRCIVHVFTHGSQFTVYQSQPNVPLLMIIFTENLNHYYMQSSSVVGPGGGGVGGCSPPPTIRPCTNLFETEILTLTGSYITIKLADLLNEMHISLCH